MSDAPPAPKVIPIALRPAAERYVHVALRLKERGGIEWTPERVQILEKKIKVVRTLVNQLKPVAPILPQLIGSEPHGNTMYWRVLIAAQSHTFVWSQICRGLVSYRGPGELGTPRTPAPPKTPAP